MADDIAANLAGVRQRVAAACQRCGRAVDAVTLVAVTKTVPAERIRTACTLGVTDIGENRVQEAQEKREGLGDLPLRWHMIGHLQSNKARLAADLFSLIHSVDSVALAEQLSRRADAAGRRLAVLLEVNAGEEESKFGFRSDLAPSAIAIAALPGLDVQGLMTVAPITAAPEHARPFFQRLRRQRDELRVVVPTLAWQHLSMGMTDDFEIAIEEGATIIRLGRAIFGARSQ
jgi:hypothetical protein